MQVTETSAEGLKREFKITVPASEVEDKISRRLGEIGRSVRIPGFRPGKVPLPLLRKRYGQAVRHEILETTVQGSSAEAMREHNVRPALPPQVEIVSAAEGADLEYKMSVELLPDMPEPDFTGLGIERLVAEVPEEDLDRFFENTGVADYNALQVQANRRFTRGLQFGVAYTLSRSRDYTSATETGTSPGRLPTYQNVRDWTYGLSSFDQTHVAVINYTWELPKASVVWNSAVTRAVLDNWQMSGITAFASGTPSGIGLSLVDSGTDLSGGGDGTRVIVTGNPLLPRGDRSFSRWFDTSVFARPARGDAGNGRKDLIRLPGVNNTDVTFFKRIPLGASGRRLLQFRWEMYNVFNHTQFSGVDTTARFDSTGKQVNPTFGQVTSTRSPRIMQGSVRFSF